MSESRTLTRERGIETGGNGGLHIEERHVSGRRGRASEESLSVRSRRIHEWMNGGKNFLEGFVES